ncbi:PREDICTED: uncharacterized protein LOC107073341 [Polistes dominula]|uniref:Uncharacterized protein LOC107073341 n=1 Tax=Polistes dominula TaxID=743375 RepID=A0ABM1JAE0_POLDO|nr:PREDICTED: uncharacterized protein LOC107073341 [Polistes dominula]
MLSKWSSALGKELKITSFICELHFNSEDVIKTNKEVLKDGSIYVYEYERVHLKKNTIPKSNAPNNANNNVNNYSLLSDDVNEVIEPDNKNSTNANLPDSTNNVINSDNLLIINEPEEFSLYSIEKILEAQPLRKNWSWTVIKDSYISLSYINLKLELVCHVKIDKDLKVTIVNAKTNLLIDMVVNISSIDCVWQLLSSLENSFFCSGTGYNDKKCSLSCTGVLLADETYKKEVEEHRCINCRKLRRLIQRRKNNTSDYEARWINIKHRLILERRKLNRVVHQNTSLRQELLNLKNQCAEIEEEVLSEKIADLPVLQQQTVRNCLFAAKAKGAKQRRYSVEWVNECLLMNAKSSSLYEYIRKKKYSTFTM